MRIQKKPDEKYTRKADFYSDDQHLQKTLLKKIIVYLSITKPHT